MKKISPHTLIEESGEIGRVFSKRKNGKRLDCQKLFLKDYRYILPMEIGQLGDIIYIITVTILIGYLIYVLFYPTRF